MLPKVVTLDTAPGPIGPRVQWRRVPGRRVAEIHYSGFWSKANCDGHLGKRQAALRAAQLPWAVEPTLSPYNPPLTPWFLRRNEIWLTVQAPFAGDGPH